MNFYIVTYPDELTQEIFTFWLRETDLVLDMYTRNRRVTKKHKYQREIYYYRLMARDSNIKVDEVPLTDNIIEQVTQRVKDRIRVVKK